MKYRILPVIIQLLILTACSQSLTLETKSEVPRPLVTQLPLNIGIYYDDKFRNYIYEENSEDRPNWSINSGTSQVQMFDQILPSMFKSVTHVSGTSNAQGDKLHAILAPDIAEMQFAMPYETKTELYEVWIKYHIRLYAPDGQLITEWPIAGYGKSSTEFLKSRDEGLNTAINSAFRDAGAKLALGFTRHGDIRQWLASIPGACNAEPENIC